MSRLGDWDHKESIGLKQEKRPFASTNAKSPRESLKNLALSLGLLKSSHVILERLKCPVSIAEERNTGTVLFDAINIHLVRTNHEVNVNN
jgi:hypothetical protein